MSTNFDKKRKTMSTSDAMMASLGMYSDYIQDNSEKIASVANNVENNCYAGNAGSFAGLEKIAGIFIDRPTPESIEDFIRRYVLNELSFFPRILEVTVDFIPSEFDKVRRDEVTEGTGVVGIKVHQKVLELPFLISGGDLMPFDIIQMDGVRVPYSRENLQKVIVNLDRQIQSEKQQGGALGESPYLGTEEYLNPTTIPGFMGDVLSIRDTHSMRKGNGMFVTAGDYEYGFEKEAGIKDLFKGKRIDFDPTEEELRVQSLPRYKTDKSGNIIGKHDLQKVTQNQFGTTLYKDSKGNFYNSYDGCSRIEPIPVSLMKQDFNELTTKLSADEEMLQIIEKVAIESRVLDKEPLELQDEVIKKGKLIHQTDVGNQFITHNGVFYANCPSKTGKKIDKQAAEEDLLGLGIFSDKRRTAEDAEKAKAKTEKEKSTTPAPKGEEEKTAGFKYNAKDIAITGVGTIAGTALGLAATNKILGKKPLPSYKTDDNGNIIGKHDLKKIGYSPTGNVLYRDSKGNYYDHFHEENNVVPISKEKAIHLGYDIDKKASEKIAGLFSNTVDQMNAKLKDGEGYAIHTKGDKAYARFLNTGKVKKFNMKDPMTKNHISQVVDSSRKGRELGLPEVNDDYFLSGQHLKQADLLHVIDEMLEKEAAFGAKKEFTAEDIARQFNVDPKDITKEDVVNFNKNTKIVRAAKRNRLINGGLTAYGLVDLANPKSSAISKALSVGIVGLGHGNHHNFKDITENYNMDSYDKLKQFRKQAEIVTDLNALLEKSASIKPMTNEEYEAITFVLKKHAAQKEEAFFEKLASDVENDMPTRKELRDIEAKSNIKFYDASTMPHGTFIVFPEKNGDEITLTPGVVLSDFADVKAKMTTNNFKCVVSQDGRIKVLKGEKFLCKAAPDKAFKFSTTSLANLYQGDTFFAITGDSVIPPSVIGYQTDIRLGGFEGNQVKSIGKCIQATVVTEKNDLDLTKQREAYSETGQYSFLTLNDKKMERMPYEDFLESKAKEQVLSAQIVDSLVPKHSAGLSNSSTVLVTDPNTKVIKIKGVINTHFRTQNEYDVKGTMNDSGIEEKVAFSMNTVSITCTNRDNKTFNVVVEYRDTDQRFMNLRRQQFNNIQESKLRAILRIIKFSGEKINEIIYKAKNEPRTNYPIPSTCTLEDIKKLQGGDLTNVSKETVQKAVSKYINPFEITKTLAVATAADMIGRSVSGLVTPENVKSVGKVFNFINKVSEEAANLSANFEKLAAERESEDMLDYARVLATSSYFHEKLAMAMNDHKNAYPSLVDVAHEIVMAKPVLEKFAYDLTTLKVNQQVHKQEVINPSLISHAILGFDQLYKTARAIETGFDKDKLKFM